TLRPVRPARVFSRSRRTTSNVLPRALISFKRLCQVDIRHSPYWLRSSTHSNEYLLRRREIRHSVDRYQLLLVPSCLGQTHFSERLFDLSDCAGLHQTSCV